MEFWEANKVPAKRRKVLSRSGAKQWLQASDRQLRVATGMGWEHYVFEPAHTEKPEEANVVCISLDQGSDQWAGVNYLLFQRAVCLIPFRDPMHRLWNDVMGAVKRSSLYPLSLMLSIAMSTDSGPWRGSKWGQQSAEATRLYLARNSESCPVFTMLYQAIAEEQGLAEQSPTAGLVATVFESMDKVYSSKVGRVPVSRWFAWVKAFENFRPYWSMRLLLNFYQAFHLDLQAGGQHRASMRLALKESDDKERSTASDVKAVQELRQKAKNGIEYTLQMLLDPDAKYTLFGMAELLEPISEFYSDMNQTLRSFQSTVEWHTCGHTVKVFCALQKTVRKLQSSLFPSSVGMASFLLHGEKGLESPDHPAIRVLDGRVSVLSKMVLHLLKNVLRSWCVEQTYPHLFARLLVPSERAKALAQMREDWQTWELCQEFGGPSWKSFRARSVFSMKCVEKVFRMAKSSDWEWSPSLDMTLVKCFSSFGQSNVIEMAVNVSKARAEKSRNNTMSDETRWLSLIDGLTDKYFKYDALQYESSNPPRGMVDPSKHMDFGGQSVARPATALTFADVSDGVKATWYSPSVTKDFTFYADLLWLREAVREEKTAKLTELWWASLVPEVGACIRRKVKGAPWRWILGDSHMMGRLTLPVLHKKCHGLDVFEFPLEWQATDVAVVFVHDPNDFEICVVEWVSPQGLAARARTAKPCEEPVCAGVAIGKPDTLLRSAARQGFHKLPKVALLQMARKLGMQPSVDSTLFELCTALIKHVWSEATDQDILEAMEHRVHKTEHIAEIQSWLQGDGLEWLDAEDREDLKHTNSKSTHEEEGQEHELDEKDVGFKEALKTYRRKVHAKSSAASGAASSTAKASKKPRKFGAIPDWLGKEIKENAVLNILPEHFRMYCDNYNRRWLLSYDKGAQLRSRSWQMYGYNQSAKLLVQHAWWVHQQRTGQPCPIDVKPESL
eukprot:4510577-Amphidinium_carterae.1